MRLKSLVNLFIVLLLGLIGALSLVAVHGLQQLHHVLDTVLNDRLVCVQQLRVVQDTLRVDLPRAIAATQDPRISDPATAARHMRQAWTRAQEQWQAYTATYLVPEEEALVLVIEPLLHAPTPRSAGWRTRWRARGRMRPWPRPWHASKRISGRWSRRWSP